MDTVTLQTCLNHILPTGQNAVFARNELKNIRDISSSFSIIVNTDDLGSPGRHWLALYIYKEGNSVCTDFFDSYGLPYTKYKLPYRYKVCHVNINAIHLKTLCSS